MKALLRTAPGEVAVVERDLPEPGPGEARIRVAACGICGSDVARFRSADDRWNHVVLGHEAAGVVAGLGSGAEGLQVGQPVALLPLAPDFSCPACQGGRYALCPHYTFYGSRQDGALAEFMVAPVRNLLPLPAGLDLTTAALLEPLSVATEACLLADGVAGASVLVMGAGAIGLLAVEMALALGAREVLACDVVPEKLALAEAFGARPVLNAEASVAAAIRDLTGGGPDVCLECSGHPAAVAEGLASLAPGGRMVLVGTGAGEVMLSAEQREQLCRRMIRLRGQWMSYRAPWPGLPWTLPLAYLQRGQIHPERILTHRYPLAEGPQAIHMMLAPGAEYIKVMIAG